MDNGLDLQSHLVMGSDYLKSLWLLSPALDNVFVKWLKDSMEADDGHTKGGVLREASRAKIQSRKDPRLTAGRTVAGDVQMAAQLESLNLNVP